MKPNEHRGGDCDNCEGNRDTLPEHDESGDECDCIDCDGGTATEDCDWCDGKGTTFWAWDLWDTCECSVCHTPDVPCTGWGEDGEDPVCWPCAVEAHARGCGCGDVTWAVKPGENDKCES